ncbi:MAG TPA: alkaline phosphatase family protein [Solirubrobacteraceae bacterium]|jgi:hypothetical protein
MSMSVRSSTAAAAAVLLLALGCGSTRPGAILDVKTASALPRSRVSRVIVLVMENKEESDIIGSPDSPYANRLAREYGLAAQSYAITHPSLPNYLALTSGSTQGVSSDCTDCHTAGTNIVDQLEAAHISWKAYMENQPNPCFTGAGSGGYAKKHNPFIYYDDIAGTARCRKIVGFGQLTSDLRHGRLPRYAWISPNLCDDGHDCDAATADRFLARTVPLLLRELGSHGFLLLTWDEGSSNNGCCAEKAGGGRIATILAGPDVRHGGRDNQPVDHYGALGTIEEAFGLAPLGGAADPSSGRLTSLFTHAPHLAR